MPEVKSLDHQDFSHHPPASLRFALASDAQDIIKIYSPSILETAFSFETEPPSVDEMKSRIAKVTQKYPWLVAEHLGRVVGYAYASQHRERPAYRWSVEVSVYVDSNHQQRGIASLLYKHLIHMLKIQGFYNAYAGITLPNDPSVALHESFGFEHLGTYAHVGYKLGRWHDVGWWSLTLNSPAPLPSEPLPVPSFSQ